MGASSLSRVPSRPLGRPPHSTRLSCCRSQCCHRDTAKQRDLTHTHYKQKQPPIQQSRVPVTRSPVLYLTLQRGLFQDVLQVCSEWLSPQLPHYVSICWEVNQNQRGLALQTSSLPLPGLLEMLDRIECWAMVKDPGPMNAGPSQPPDYLPEGPFLQGHFSCQASVCPRVDYGSHSSPHDGSKGIRLSVEVENYLHSPRTKLSSGKVCPVRNPVPGV